MSRYTGPLDCKVYVGGLSRTASKEEVERAFSDFGKLTNVFVARNPPGFAFIEFEDKRDAEDAVKALDGRMLCGSRVRVEISHGKSRPKGPFRGRGGPPRRRRSRSFDRRAASPANSRSRSRSRSDRDDSGRPGREERDTRRRPRQRSRSRS